MKHKRFLVAGISLVFLLTFFTPCFAHGARTDQAMASTTLIRDDLRDRPLPQLDTTRTALDYHQIKINLSGKQSKEQLVDVRSYGVKSRSAYARAIAPYYKPFPDALTQVWVRESVAKKLARANKLLHPYGAELLVLDGFRPIKLQLDLWNYFRQKAQEVLTDPTEADLVAFAGKFCSDPRTFDKDNYQTWPVHNTGGAVDVTLQSLNSGQELFMGSIFDQPDSKSNTCYFENPTPTDQNAIAARGNRRLLFHVMTAVGFINYPHEWWHFDYGTQMWVLNGGYKCAALYGRAELE